MDDKSILIPSINGDHQAMTELISKYMPIIVAKAKKYQSFLLEQDDLVQEGLIGFLDAIRSYDEGYGCSFKTYCSICVENKIKNAIIYHNSLKNKILTESVPLDIADLSLAIDKASESPEDIFLAQEQFSSVKKKIDSLLSELELKVLSCYLKAYDYEQIAAILSISRKSVDNSMQRVRKKLRQLL